MKIVSNGKILEIPSCSSQDIYSLEEQVVGQLMAVRFIGASTSQDLLLAAVQRKERLSSNPA